MLVAIHCPPENTRGPQHFDHFLSTIHRANTGRHLLSLEIGRHEDTVGLYCRFPQQLSGVVEDLLYAQYPDSKIDSLSDGALDPPEGHRVWRATLRLTPDCFPCKRYPEFQQSGDKDTPDPIAALLTALAPEGSVDLRGHIRVTLRPAGPRARVSAERCLLRLATPFFRSHARLSRLYASTARSGWLVARVFAWILGALGRERSTERELATSTTRFHEHEPYLQAGSDKLNQHLFHTWMEITVSGPKDAGGQARTKISKVLGAVMQFSLPQLGTFRVVRRFGFRRARFLMSTEEIATLVHLPTEMARAASMTVLGSRELEPPANLPTKKEDGAIAVLGEARFRGRGEVFGIRQEDARRHLYLVGKTGMGKTSLVFNLVASDIRAGRGLGVVDVHGDLADKLLSIVPPARTNDVVLFDASDTLYPVSFNVLSCPLQEQRPLVASGIVSAFRKLHENSWGPRLEHILRNAVLALLEVPGTSLVSLLRLLSDPTYRKTVTARLTDPVVRSFWLNEFARWKPALQAEAVASTQNKIGHFISSPILRNLVGQSRGRLDLRRVMDEGKILIVNLSKGRIGEDNSSLLGSFLVTKIQLAAMSRADTPEEERRDWTLYCDEFQSLATESFATILSEARKFRLACVLSHQFTEQLDETLRSAIFGNVGTMVCFQAGVRDAEILAEQLGPEVTPHDLMRLPKYHALVGLLIDGSPSRPFSMHTLRPTEYPSDPVRPEKIRRASRDAYARPLAKVEAEIKQAFAHA